MSKAKSKAPTPKVPEAPQAMVYCGPTIRGVAHQFTVFCGGLPTALRAVVKQVPVLAELIVPVDRLAETRLELQDPQSTSSLFYSHAINSLNSFKRGK